MRKGKKIFPYPTLNNSSNINCFKNSTFEFICEISEDESNIILQDIRYCTENKTILKLIEEGKAKASIIVECSSTVFRKIYDITEVGMNIEISKSLLRDKVEISCFIYATENIEYSDPDFLDDYEGYSFEIDKYDILAIDDGITTKIEYNESDDKKVSSIFRIIKSFEETELMKIEALNKIIKITLPEKQFDYYDTLKNNDNFQFIFFSMLAIPALIKCFDQIKMTYQDIDEVCINFSWFNSICEAYKKIYNREMDYNDFYDEPSEILAQKLLNNASTKGIEDLFTKIFEDVGGWNDED